jgi:hypothetical protein
MSDPVASTSQTRYLPFEENLCIRPLFWFHGRIFSPCSTELDSSGIFCDLLSRITMVIISPLAYLALGFLALLGVVITPCFTQREIIPVLAPQQEEIVDANPDIFSTMQLCHEDIINALERFNPGQNSELNWQNIAAIKLYIRSNAGESSLTDELKFQKVNDASLDRSYVQEKITEAFDETSRRHASSQEFTEAARLEVKWVAFLKDSNGRFSFLRGDRLFEANRSAAGGFRDRESSGLGQGNFTPQLAVRLLKALEIPPHPLLDAENNFI